MFVRAAFVSCVSKMQMPFVFKASLDLSSYSMGLTVEWRYGLLVATP